MSGRQHPTRGGTGLAARRPVVLATAPTGGSRSRTRGPAGRHAARQASSQPPVRCAGAPGDAPVTLAQLAQAVTQEMAALRARLRLRPADGDQVPDAAAERETSEIDQANAELARQVTFGVREQLLRRLHALEAAAARIAAGAYGLCTRCGGAIPLARLRAMPCATLCLACQSASEGARSA